MISSEVLRLARELEQGKISRKEYLHSLWKLSVNRYHERRASS